jgi:hypothetical protein
VTDDARTEAEENEDDLGGFSPTLAPHEGRALRLTPPAEAG